MCGGISTWQVTRSMWDSVNLNIWIVQVQEMLSQMRSVQKEKGIDNFSLWNEVELSLSWDQKGHWKAELKGTSSIVLHAVLHPYMHHISTEIILPCVALNMNWNKISLKFCNEALLLNLQIFWTIALVLYCLGVKT